MKYKKEFHEWFFSNRTFEIKYIMRKKKYFDKFIRISLMRGPLYYSKFNSDSQPTSVKGRITK